MWRPEDYWSALLSGECCLNSHPSLGINFPRRQRPQSPSRHHNCTFHLNSLLCFLISESCSDSFTIFSPVSRHNSQWYVAPCSIVVARTGAQVEVDGRGREHVFVAAHASARPAIARLYVHETEAGCLCGRGSWNWQAQMLT